MSPSDPAGTQPAGTPAAAVAAGVIRPVGHGRVGWSDAARRHEWAAAYRHAAAEFTDPNGTFYDGMAAIKLEHYATEIEAGNLSPWADTPEPSTPPAQPSHTAPAAADGHPGTLDGPGVLGRALLDEYNLVWLQVQPGVDSWRSGTLVPQSRERIERSYTVREVLLVDPARLQVAGRVLDEARQWRRLRSVADGDRGARLAAATGRRWAAAQLRALLADRDRLMVALMTRSEQLHEALTEKELAEEAHDGLKRIVDSTRGYDLDHLRADRDAARAELAEMTASRDRWHGHALDLRAELATARRDAAADALRMAGAKLAQAGHHAAADDMRGLEAEVRSGTRTIPGSPEPASAGGEEHDA